MTKFAYAYVRKSTNRADAQQYSLETQKREILDAKKKAEQHFGEDVEILEWFEENISGGKEDRPEFQKMCRNFKEGKADLLLSWRLDRLSRNPIDSGQIMWAVQKGIIPYIQDSSRLYEKKDSGLIMSVIFGMGNQELMEFAEKSASGVKTLINNGGVPGKVPFGYRNVKDVREVKYKVAVVERELRYVKKMFKMRAEGITYEGIADFLFDSGFTKANGKVHGKSTIETWIRNPFYYGVTKWGAYRSNHIYPTIINKELWERANGVSRGNVSDKQKRHNSFPLKGMVTSSESRRNLVASFAKKTHVMYHTHSRYKGREEIVSISETRLFEEFGNNIHHYKLPTILKPLILENLREFFKEQIDFNNKERIQIQKKITRTKTSLDDLMDMRINGEISAEKYAEKNTSLEEQHANYIVMLKEIRDLDSEIMKDISKSVELFTNLDSYWKNGDRDTKIDIIKMIAVELIITPDKTLYTKENSLFEGVRNLNKLPLEVLLCPRSNRTALQDFVKVLYKNPNTCRNAVKILEKIQ